MNTFSRFLVITSLVAALSGCLGSGTPNMGQRAQALQEVDAKSLPSDLMSCDEFYGEDWDIPDAILIVKERPGLVVLVQADEMVCSGRTNQLAVRLRDMDLGVLLPLNGENDTPMGGYETGISARTADSPVGDSNPLPATPGGGSAESPVGDSNPLPAVPSVNDDSGTVDDSNPLPAYDDSSAASLVLTGTPTKL